MLALPVFLPILAFVAMLLGAPARATAIGAAVVNLLIGLAAAATADTGLGVTLGNWWEAPADAAFAVLSPEEARFLDVLADAAFPPGGDPAIGGSAAGAARYVDGILLAMVGDQRSLLRLSFHAFDAATLPTHGAHFSALDAAEAQAVMLGWLRSPIPELRSAFTSVYLFIGMAWTTHPEVVAKIAPMFRCGYGR